MPSCPPQTWHPSSGHCDKCYAWPLGAGWEARVAPTGQFPSYTVELEFLIELWKFYLSTILLSLMETVEGSLGALVGESESDRVIGC